MANQRPPRHICGMPIQLKSGRFYGRTLRKRTVGELTLADVSYPGGARLPHHRHERAYFCLILGGSYTEVYGRGSRYCSPSTLVFHPAGEMHAQRFTGNDVASFNVEIGSGWLRRLSETGLLLDRPAEFCGGPVVALAKQLFAEFLKEDRDSDLSIEKLAYEILAASADRHERPARVAEPSGLTSSRELLDVQFREPITLGVIARGAGVHPVHFAATFRRFYGCSVGEYLRHRRLEFALSKLANSTMTAAEIAHEAGYADQSHLARTFKRVMGQTPGQYRSFLPFNTRSPFRS